MKYPTLFALLSFVATMFTLGCQNAEDNVAQAPPLSPNLPGAPLIPDLSVLRPYFQTTLGNVDVGSAVGTAFAVEHHGTDSPIVLTALSILGPVSVLASTHLSYRSIGKEHSSPTISCYITQKATGCGWLLSSVFLQLSSYSRW